MTTAINIFVRQSLRQGGIPFEITTQTDPFYNPSNVKWSRRIDDTSRLVYRIQSAIPRIELLMQKKAKPLQRWGLAMELIRDTDDIFSAAPA